MATLKLRFFDWLFQKVFGDIDIDAEIFTNSDSILIVQFVVRSKRGTWAFPILHKQLPPAGSGFILDAVEAIDSAEAGVIDHVGGLLDRSSSSTEETADDSEDAPEA